MRKNAFYVSIQKEQRKPDAKLRELCRIFLIIEKNHVGLYCKYTIKKQFKQHFFNNIIK